MLALSAAMGEGVVAGPGLFCGDASAHPGLFQYRLHALLAGGGPLSVFFNHGANRASGGGDDDGAWIFREGESAVETGVLRAVAVGTWRIDLAAMRDIHERHHIMANDHRPKSRLLPGPEQHWPGAAPRRADGRSHGPIPKSPGNPKQRRNSPGHDR